MADVFLCYSRTDTTKAQRLQAALEDNGFTVFWDRKLEASEDWDKVIRTELPRAKAAVVLWSKASGLSDYVRHEAAIAKQFDLLVPALVEPMTAVDFPSGHYMEQAPDLIAWDGDRDAPGFRALCAAIEKKIAAWNADLEAKVREQIVLGRDMVVGPPIKLDPAKMKKKP